MHWWRWRLIIVRRWRRWRWWRW
uniref:Uncharacterized protein n=1 Tax=Rhizophora mucronata TaxID=61149 RepID=A0A2P2PKX9_RHIMU